MASYQQGNYSLGYVDPTDRENKNLSAMIEHFYNSSYPQNSAWQIQADIDKRFKAGDQRLNSLIYGPNDYYNARRYFFNLIRKHENMICGYQRRNRKSTITQPRNQSDILSDDYNKVLKWSEARDGFQEYYSQAFESAVNVGMSLLHLYPDYTFDPISGDLFTDCVTFQNFLIDPYFRKQDLSDCTFIWRRRWVNKNSAKNLLPGMEKEIDKLQTVSTKDSKFPLQAELNNLQTSRLMPYDEVHYQTTREAKIIIDPMSNESALFEPDNEEEEEEELAFIMQQQPWLIVQKKQVPTVKLIIKVGDSILYHGENHCRIDMYPFAPMLCYYEPDMQSLPYRVQGVTRGLRDAQFLYNRRKVIELEILESQINSGWIYPVDCVTDEKAFRQTGQGFLVPLKKGRQPNEVQRIDPPQIPPSMLELSRQLAEDITAISGVNEELLGSATDDKAGILSMLRQGAGLTTLQGIFDRADYTQRIYGKIRLSAIRKLFSKAKIEYILGHPMAEGFKTADSQKFEVAVEEGNYTTTQRQQELQQLLHFRSLEIPIPNKSIIRAAFITNKDELIKDMEEEQQAQMQAQQQQAQIESQRTNAEIMQMMAKAESDKAKAQEYLASSSEKIAKIEDIQAAAEHKETEADLNLVKMMIELEDLDLKNFKESLELAQVIKNEMIDKPSQPRGTYGKERNEGI